MNFTLVLFAVVYRDVQLSLQGKVTLAKYLIEQSL